MQLLMTLNVLEGIITKPIVQSAREANIPLWLALPTITCTVLGAVLVFSPSSVVGGPGTSWIGIFYFACGAAFFLGSLLSWYIATFRILNTRDKTKKKHCSTPVCFYHGCHGLPVSSNFCGIHHIQCHLCSSF